MALEKDLKQMLSEGVITAETARSIEDWYHQKSSPDNRRLILIFGVLGALLVVSGILLVLAHNWDHFSTTVKTIWAFSPLVLGQLAVGYTLLRKRDQEWWREVSASWLALSVGVTLAMVAQIYHLPGDLDTFLLTWLLLGGLLVYLLPSRVVALLFLAGSGWYASEAGYGWQQSVYAGSWFWLLLLYLAPMYYRLWQNNPEGFFTRLFHAGFPVVLLIGLGMHVGKVGYGWMWIAFAAMLSIFYMTGTLIKAVISSSPTNGYHFFGWVGSLLLLYMAGFNDFWKEMMDKESLLIKGEGLPGLLLGILLVALASVLLWYTLYKKKIRPVNPLAFAYGLFAIMVAVAFFEKGWAVLFANLFVLFLGVWIIIQGAREASFARLNIGLGLIALLAICRFFDTDLSFVLRGIIFITVGLGFGLANYRLLQKSKGHA